MGFKSREKLTRDPSAEKVRTLFKKQDPQPMIREFLDRTAMVPHPARALRRPCCVECGTTTLIIEDAIVKNKSEEPKTICQRDYLKPKHWRLRMKDSKLIRYISKAAPWAVRSSTEHAAKIATGRA
jgi:hypothetical protein